MYPAEESPDCGFLVMSDLTRAEQRLAIVPDSPETPRNFVDTCRATKERKAYCCGTFKGGNGAPVTECAEVKSTGLLGAVFGSVDGILGGVNGA